MSMIVTPIFDSGPVQYGGFSPDAAVMIVSADVNTSSSV